MVVTATTGAFTYTPDSNYNGSDSFVLWVSDDDGTTKVTGTYNVTVNAVNDAPTISPSAITTNEDQAASSTIVANDVDNDTLTYGLSSDASNGTVVVTATTGAFTYTPDSNYNGSDSFVLWVSDDDGTTKVTGTYNVTVNAVNDAPTISPSDITTNEDQAASSTIVANDVDNDTLTYGFASDASNGTVVVTATTGAFTYTPDSNYNGSDSFVLWVSDDDGTSKVTGTYNVTVNAANDAPQAQDVFGSGDEGGTITTILSATDVDSSDPTTFVFEQRARERGR